MTKAQFGLLCKSHRVNFHGYSGKTKTAYVSGKTADLSRFLQWGILNLNIPFGIKGEPY